MGFVAVDNLEQGMIIGEDVRDINTRLLLSKGQKIDFKHIRVLKIWGVTEVNVVGAQSDRAAEMVLADPQKERRIKDVLDTVFKQVNLKNPILNEIYRIALAYRLQGELPPSPVSEFEAFKNGRVLSEPEQIRRQIQKIDAKLPEAPTIISELNDVIADPFATSNDVAQVVNKSPSLAALLLKIVNSAYYGFPSRIDRISRAVTIIGTKEISGLALGICVMRSFNDIPAEVIDMQAFIRHSLACGMVARILGALKNMEQTEQLFVSGLLHDIGKLIVFKYLPEYTHCTMNLAISSGESVFSAEKKVLGMNHTRIARYLLKKWRFPEGLENNVVFHHTPGKASDPIKAGILQLADLIANALGIGASGERTVPACDELILESIGVSARTLQMVIRQAIHQLGPMEAVFSS
ncbi:MAG: HDOD domain-containing protein [Desulfobacteraceae bacterium]